jgi:hypothetical protein
MLRNSELVRLVRLRAGDRPLAATREVAFGHQRSLRPFAGSKYSRGFSPADPEIRAQGRRSLGRLLTYCREGGSVASAAGSGKASKLPLTFLFGS